MHMTSVVSAWALLTRDLLDTAAGQAGVDLREVSALNLIETHPGSSIDWLGTRVGLTHSGTVRLVDRLENAGWLTRARAGREVGLRVTAAGRAVLRRWRRAADAAVAQAMARSSRTGRRRWPGCCRTRSRAPLGSGSGPTAPAAPATGGLVAIRARSTARSGPTCLRSRENGDDAARPGTWTA